MPPKTGLSKLFAVAFIVLTAAAIAGMVAMLIVYKTQIAEMNPTPRPTIPSTTMAPPPVMRLPRNLLPESYNIFIQPQLYIKIIEEVNVTSPNQTLLFSGNSTVHFHCVERTSRIYLHSNGPTVSAPRLIDKDANELVKIDRYLHHEDESHFLELQLSEYLEAGRNYSLFLAFEGEMSENLEALYVSKYVESRPASENETIAERFLAATNLEPTNARSLFPCFDEPDFKAVFYLTVIHRLETTALSNAPVSVSNIIDEEWKYTRFMATPRMSSYLLAFTVSEFTATDSPNSRIVIKTYSRPEATAAGHAVYAAQMTPKILEFYENHFDLRYPMKTLDQIALTDLEPLAMENWGLITYQEGALLYQEGVSSWLQKEDIVHIISHELAHQWFGNLVTMKWWNEVWLNEGFASYMSYLAVDNAEPSFQIKDTMIMSELHSAFEEDALTSSHPLSTPLEEVQTTSQILGMFDAISYSKGAMVLRMLADLVGEDVFDNGIRAYLKAFKGKNVEQSDLWDFIQSVRQEKGVFSVGTLMEKWTTQMGYPVITINTTNGEIHQKHFLYNNSAESDLWWLIPIRYATNRSSPSLVWLDVRGPVRKEEFISKNKDWILANVNCTGYYRVNYDPDNWQRLMTQLETNPNRIPLMNRGQLVDDAFNLARAELVNVTLALNSTRFLRHETAYLPWESAVRNLEYFVLMFDRSEVYGPMQVYLREQVKELYNFFRNYTDNSIVPEDHSLQHNQIIAIDVACSNGLPECIEMAQSKFAGWMKSNDTNDIHTNLRAVIYCQAVAAGDKKEWEFAWEKFQSSTDTSEKDQLRKALACTKKTWLLSRYLEYTLDPDKIRLMDVASTVYFIAQNAAGQALAWNFIRANWDYVSQGESAGLIMGVTSRFSTKFELEELMRFATQAEEHVADIVMMRAVEQTQVNIQWVNENKNIILWWFERETANIE
uniref:Aminopeptidase n=2 Tax=Nothobranchius rachovii TaxID=451742 RepID=A0A1A8PTP5_9TELE